MLGTMVLVLFLIYLTLSTFYFFFRVFEEHQKKEIEKNLNWFGEREVTKEDFDCQREVMYLLREKLRGEQDV